MPYIGKGANGFGIRETFQYTSTSNQTAFTGSDINSKTLSFDNGSLVDVLLNGVMLKPTTDYNTSTANTITLTSGATASDEVMIIVYDVFSLSDAMPKTGGTFSGALSGVDVNGTELILDADADTSITADTDDQIDFKVGGTDTVVVTPDAMELKGPHPAFTLTDSDDNNYGGLFYNNGAISLTADHGATGATGTLNFQIDGGTKATITSGGNLGINTTSPDAKLDVEGTTDAEMRITRTTATTDTTFNDAGSVLNLVNNVNYENGYNGGASIGQILFTSNDTSTGAGVRAKISCKATTYYHAEELQFFVSPSNTGTGIASATSQSDALRMAINPDGTVKIGLDIQSTAHGMRVHNNSGNATIQARNSNGGNMVFQGLNLNGSQSSTISESGVGFFANGVSSDETLKNVKGVMNDGWNKLKDIQPKSFTWKKITTETNEEGKEVEVKSDDDLDGNIHYGVMAQDLKKIIPELAYGEEGSMSVDYNGLLMVAINTIKELEARIKALEEA